MKMLEKSITSSIFDMWELIKRPEHTVMMTAFINSRVRLNGDTSVPSRKRCSAVHVDLSKLDFDLFFRYCAIK